MALRKLKNRLSFPDTVCSKTNKEVSDSREQTDILLELALKKEIIDETII